MNPEAAWYPGPEDLGIDEHMRRKLAAVLLDESINLPYAERSWTENRLEDWDQQTLLAYGAWLCGICQLEPSKTRYPPAQLFARASRLGLGPSEWVINHCEEIGSITEFQRQLGFVPRFPFRDWTKDRMIQEGIALAKEHGRPTDSKLDELSRQGIFPGRYVIKSRFGNLRNFHESIGMPSFKRAEKEELIEWGLAFVRQNPGVRLDYTAINILSKHKVGPSLSTICEHFGGSVAFWQELELEQEAEAYWHEMRIENRQQELKRLIDTGVVPITILDDPEQASRLRAAALFELNHRLGLKVVDSEMRRIVNVKDPNKAVPAMLKGNKNLSVAMLEIEAERLGVYEDIRPAKRFDNVDLQLV